MLTSSCCRWQIPTIVISACLLLWMIGLISMVTSANSVQDHDALTPQPATPPKPAAFDPTDDDYDQVQVDDLPASPSPATPPKVTSQKYIFSDNNSKLPSSNNESIYNGKEYRFKRFVIRPAELKLEGCLLFTLIIYVIISYNGKRKNEKMVIDWIEANSQILKKEFSHVGHGLPRGKNYIANGPALFYGYATGRKGCQSLTISFALRPRQDIPFMIYEEVRAAIDLSWTGRSDRIELVWSLTPNHLHKTFDQKDSFVWAIVEKRVMNSIREDRWDLRTFTEVKESDLLPSQLVLMFESGEISEQIIKNKELGLVQLFQPSCLQWFDSLILSGSPQEEPLISELPLPSIPTSRTLTLRLRLPPSTQTLDTLPLLQFSFNLIDTLDRNNISLTSIATSKLNKRRTEISNLLLEDERKNQERVKEEERRKRIKAAHDEKFAKMSPNEQRKFDERERKRNAAKISKATVKRK